VELAFRSASLADMPYVLDSFRLGMRGSPWLGDATASRMLVTLLARDGWSVTIACAPGVEDEILGYVVHHRGPQTVAWICVKAMFQHLGIAKALLAHVGVDLERPVNAVFATKAALDEARKHRLMIHMRPYMVSP
jgi:hypothetical protein